MYLFQHFFLLPLLFSFFLSSLAVNSGTKDSHPSTSHVIHLNPDLHSLVFSRLDFPPTALSLFPKGYVTKDHFHACLEDWLVHLKKERNTWSDDKLANVKGANKIAKDLGLTGEDQDTSLKLSDTPGNTQPAPWVESLSIIILKASSQLFTRKKPTALMPWIFIPDGQVFHFILAYQKDNWYVSIPEDISPRFDDPLYSRVMHQLLPKSDINFIKNKFFNLGISYVRHNRNPTSDTKSQVGDLTEYKERDLYKIWDKLMGYPWLKGYVKFGKTATGQLLSVYETQLNLAKEFKRDDTEIKKLKVWLSEQLRD